MVQVSAAAPGAFQQNQAPLALSRPLVGTWVAGACQLGARGRPGHHLADDSERLVQEASVTEDFDILSFQGQL